MFEVVCVTSRKSCESFFAQLEKIAESGVKAIILREKDLSEDEYFILAKEAKEICEKHGRELIIHNFKNVALKLGIKKIHYSFTEFCKQKNPKADFDTVGTSVHCASDAELAERLGADYITAGHIFETDCKKGLEPRGVKFLKSVCDSVNIPVYAIGGIDENTVKRLCGVKSKSFAGVCLMSSLMKSNKPQALVNSIKENYNTRREIFKLYAVTDRRWLNGRRLYDDVESAIKGGATMLQLREKTMSHDDFLSEAREIQALCQSCNVPLIINDNVPLAKEIGAEGVHLGQSDMSPSQARKILGKNAIIGATARSVEQAVKAELEGADYIGSGAVFGTVTKGNAVKMSLETLNSICNAVSVPVTAIGGITKENVLSLKGVGISGVAVVSGIFAEKDIENSARELKLKVEAILNG